MDYQKNGFIDEDNYLDYVASLEKYHKSTFKEPEPKWWVDTYPELRHTLEDLSLNLQIKLSKWEENYSTLAEKNEKKTGTAKLIAEVMLEQKDKQITMGCKKLINFYNLALYIPSDNPNSNIITPDQIAMAKTVPIENFMGGSPKTSGQKLFFRCPFHEEKSASFCVFLKDNTYHCFGCAESGDSIAFIRKFENLDFANAVRFLLGTKK